MHQINLQICVSKVNGIKGLLNNNVVLNTETCADPEGVQTHWEITNPLCFLRNSGIEPSRSNFCVIRNSQVL